MKKANKKIYIIGPPGAGKSTLATSLSKKLNIPKYELDLLVYDDENGHRKRTDEEIEKLFSKILKEKSWIIEDVGRSKFEKGRIEADKIYYLRLNKVTIYKRVLFRWIKQKLGLLKYNYPPSFNQLIDIFKTTKSYYKKENRKLKELKEFSSKVEFLNTKKISNLKKSK